MEYLLIGLIISIIYSILVLPEKCGFNPKLSFTLYPLISKGMVIIPISKEKAIHIHHWIIAALIILFFNKYLITIIWFFAFLAGIKANSYISAILSFICFFFSLLPSVSIYISKMTFGFLIGLMLQGLNYNDAFDIIIPNPYNK